MKHHGIQKLVLEQRIKDDLYYSLAQNLFEAYRKYFLHHGLSDFLKPNCILIIRLKRVNPVKERV